MSQHSITLKRDEKNIERWAVSDESIATVAYNALSSIPGIEAKRLKIAEDSDEQVTVTYNWIGDHKFNRIDEHLHEYGLVRVKKAAPTTK
ncbi:MAG: hypothetical protein WC047_08990 [Kiritimatiellales bacterium]